MSVSTTTSVDPKKLTENIGADPDLLKELVEIFAAHYPTQLHSLQEAIADCDCTLIGEVAHLIKGSVSIFGSPVSELAKNIEVSAGDNNLENIEQLFDGLKSGIESLHQELVSISS